MEVTLFFLTVLFWTIFAVSFHLDRSRYRNCYFLFTALIVTALFILFNLGDYSLPVMILLATITFLAILTVPFFLIINGIVMFKREGHSLSNLLSFAFGMMIGLGELAAFAAILLPEVNLSWEPSETIFSLRALSLLLSVSVIYISVVFVIFMIYCIFLQIIPRKKDFDYVIIHGAGLIDGQRMSKLLSQRVDKAIEVYQKDPTPPILIPSGGRGSDEKISEAEAMREYLLEKGIPAEKIIAEDQSKTTYENLLNSKKIIDERKGGKYIALVTSNYHVYRALRYCRKIGLKCIGIGSPVAFYYWPSALIREFIAVHAEKKRFIILILGWVIWITPLLLAYK